MIRCLILTLLLGMLVRGPALAQQSSGADPALRAAGTPTPRQLALRAVGVVSGGIDGTYVRIAADLAAVLDDGPRLRIVPIIGKGSVQNIDDLLNLRGVDVAIVQSDVLAYIRRRGLLQNAERSIEYIAKLYDEELHILVGPGIATMKDLAGRAVNVDVFGSGTALTASTVFESLKIPITAVNDDQATALEKLRKGEIAALAFVAGKPARLFLGLDGASGLHFLPIPMTPALLETYLPARLDRTDYPALVGSANAVDTVAVGAVMATFAWPKGSDGYRRLTYLVERLFTEFPRLRVPPRHPKWREVSLDAQVSGWKRFPAADDLVRRSTSIGVDRGNNVRN